MVTTQEKGVAMEVVVRGAKRMEGAVEEKSVKWAGRRRRKGVMASGSSGCLSRVGGGWRRTGARRGAATEAGLFVKRLAVVFRGACFVVLFYSVFLGFVSLRLGSRRRVAVGGVGDGETGSTGLYIGDS
jgi:hypothetical protein